MADSTHEHPARQFPKSSLPDEGGAVASPAASPALIRYGAHPDHPGVTLYEIDAATADACQSAITDIMNRADDEGGAASFDWPQRHYSIQDGGKRWRARGYVRSAQ